MRLKTRSSGADTWWCDACGATNDDSQQFCTECKAERLVGPAAPKPPADDNIRPEAPLPEPSTEPEDIDEAQDEPLEPVEEEPEITPQPAAPTPSAPTAGPGRYYLIFVNTPAQSLIKSKVQIDFDDFPIISLGRSPENVVVIPDQEVSRKHAELSIAGGKVVLKDLKSKNGTYLYNGKEFQQVSDSVEVKPNSLLKFGTGTIVRLTSG